MTVVEDARSGLRVVERSEFCAVLRDGLYTPTERSDEASVSTSGDRHSILNEVERASVLLASVVTA